MSKPKPTVRGHSLSHATKPWKDAKAYLELPKGCQNSYCLIDVNTAYDLIDQLNSWIDHVKRNTQVTIITKKQYMKEPSYWSEQALLGPVHVIGEDGEIRFRITRP